MWKWHVVASYQRQTQTHSSSFWFTLVFTQLVTSGGQLPYNALLYSQSTSIYSLIVNCDVTNLLLELLDPFTCSWVGCLELLLKLLLLSCHLLFLCHKLWIDNMQCVYMYYGLAVAGPYVGMARFQDGSFNQCISVFTAISSPGNKY